MKRELRETERKILEVLKEDARATYSDIGKRVGLSRTAVKNTITSMEEDGIIFGYKVITDDTLRDSMDNIEQEIYKKMESNGMIETKIEYFGENSEMELPFYEETKQKRIDEMGEEFYLSVRAFNCMKRAGIDTVGKALEYIKNANLLTLRNLGLTTRAEIYVAVCNFGYKSLDEKSKKDFIKSLLKLNTLIK